MPFQKGNQLGREKGRGYELNEIEKNKLRTLLKKGLYLAEKIAKSEATIKEQMAYRNIEKLVLKILDKFVPNKTALDVTGGLNVNEIIKIDSETQKLLDEFIIWRKSKL